MTTIKKIQFYTPATVTYENDNGIVLTCKVDVDFREQKVRIPASFPAELADLFFPFLNESLRLPENSFEADAETYNEAHKANQEFERAYSDHVGGDDGGTN